MNNGLNIGLDLGFKVNNTNGVGANVVVVQDTNAYEAKLPGAANAGKILGVTIESTSATGRGCNVRMGGIAYVKVASAVAVGDLVNIADTAGRIKKVSEAAGTVVYVLGQALTAASNANEMVEVLLTPGVTLNSAVS